MEIIVEEGFAADKDVEGIINSANGLLCHDSSGAGRIREKSAPIEDYEAFEKDLDCIPEDIKNFYELKSQEHGWKFKKANWVAAKMIMDHGDRFHLGNAILDTDSLDIPIMHAITMSYDLEQDPIKRIPGTDVSVRESYDMAIRTFLKLGVKSIAMPIPIARKNYGLDPEVSYHEVMRVLSRFKEEDIKVIVCLDNKDTKEWYYNNK